MSNSADALSWAKNVSRGHPMAARMLLIVGLSMRVNNDDDSFTVFPSIRQLAEDTDMSRSTVKRWIAYLASKEVRLIEIFEATRENGGRSSNRYRLAIHTIHVRPDGSLVEINDTPRSNLTQGGGFRMNRGGVQIGPGGGSTGEPCNINSESGTESLEHTRPPDGGEGGELPLGLPPIPTEEDLFREFTTFVEESWAGLCAAVPAVRPLRGGLGEGRAKKAFQLARQFAEPGETEREVWEQVFTQILSSRWMCGEKKGRDERIFKLQMTWLLEKRNFEKTVEGKFGDDRDPDLPGSAQSGRSPASEALAIVVQRRRAGRERRAGGRG